MKLYNIIRSDQLNIAELFMSKYKQKIRNCTETYSINLSQVISF